MKSYLLKIRRQSHRIAASDSSLDWISFYLKGTQEGNAISKTSSASWAQSFLILFQILL